MKFYKDLEIYQLAFQYAIEVHHLSLKLPKFELYEQGGQVRRSSKSVKVTIVNTNKRISQLVSVFYYLLHEFNSNL